MWQNHLIIALRNLYKRRFFTSINMLGLILGLCCCALVVLFVRHELAYDKFHPHYQDIYRLIYRYRSQNYTVTGFTDWWDTSPEEQLIKPELLKKIPEIREAAHFNVTYGETMGDHPTFIEVERPGTTPERFSERKVLLTNTGKELLRIFEWPLIAGDSARAIASPYTAILTEQTARKYYGEAWQEQYILDRTLRWEGQDYRITGVIEDIPEYAHYQFDLILQTPSVPSWGVYTYVLLHPEADVSLVNQKINDALISLEPAIADNPQEEGSFLQPIADIHLYSDYLYELKPPGDIRYIYAFSLIGIIILLITCTNYINLSVAMYAGRHREIGMRKVLGAQQKNIVTQFLTEAVMLTLACLPVSLLLLQLILPFFNRLMDLQLHNDFLTSFPMLALIISIALAIGLLSGLYPAYILARKHVVRLFKEGLVKHGEGLVVRRSLVIFQFILLISLSSATFFINQQLQYMHTKDVGFDKEGVVSFNPVSMEKFNILKNTLSSYPAIQEIGTGILPGMRMSGQISYKLIDQDEQFADGSLWELDYSAARALGIRSEILTRIEAEDRDFKEILLINASAARALGMAARMDSEDELIGKTVVANLEYRSDSGDGYGDPYVISGFVEDVHLHSLRQEVNPLFIRITKEPDWLYHAILKIDTKELNRTINLIEEAYYDVEDKLPFEIHFLEEQLRKLYEQEQRVSILTIYLSAVAIILAILGLVGLTAYLTNLRVREIGIRKVMGASVGEILLLLNREFILMVTIATVIAAPVAYLAVSRWLSDFAYKININVLFFLLIGFGTFWIAVIVVTIQSMKAATSNPITTLRSNP